MLLRLTGLRPLAIVRGFRLNREPAVLELSQAVAGAGQSLSVSVTLDVVVFSQGLGYQVRPVTAVQDPRNRTCDTLLQGWAMRDGTGETESTPTSSSSGL